MRSNTTFHPEILFDWPPWMFHVLLEEHRKICVKVMLSWMWWLCSSWHVVPVRVIVSRSRASSGSQLPILRLGLTPAPVWAGRAAPTPPIHRGVISRGIIQGATVLMWQSRGYSKCWHFLPIFPATAAHYPGWWPLTIHPRCCVLSLCGRVRPGTHWPRASPLPPSQLSRKRTAARYRPECRVRVNTAITDSVIANCEIISALSKHSDRGQCTVR